MKRKVRVKSLPKAQMGFNYIPSQGIKPYDIYPPLGSMPKAITPNMMGLNVPTQQQWEKQNGKLSMTGDFLKRKKDFGIPTYDPSIPGSRMSQDIRNQEQTLREGEVASTTPPNISAAQDTSNYVKSFTDANGQNKKGNQFLAPALLAATDVFSSVARKFQNRDAKRDLKDQFLSDNLFNPRPEDYSGNRGDYTVNTPGLGDYFRPDEHVYGDYNKIAQMGGEMKRKIKITSLPQAAYGGTQNSKAVNQLYGNSSYMTSMFNGTNKDESEEQYNQTLNADPRSTAVLEAEKGETLVRKGTSDAIPQFFKIGGKRHSEGGTPLSGEKATPDSFIYSDTKAMKIKDPAILESFGFAAKKGGYTPAKISKKFDLNSKELREGLYSQDDLLRKRTSVLMTDNYISNLGKLALVQESQKGFPQGVPEIAMPYMNKVGLDPAQFLPPSPQEGMAMAMYGGIPKAQIGQSVNPGGISNVSIDNLPQYEIDWLKFKQRANDPNQPLPSTQEYMAAQRAYNKSKWDNSSMINPLNWGPGLNYGFTGQFENMGDSYSKYNGEGPMTTAIRYGTDPVFMGLAATNYGKALGMASKMADFELPGVRNFLQKASLPNILEAGTLALKDVATGIKNVPANLTALANAALPYANITLPYIQKLASPAALGLLIYSHGNDEPLTTEQEIALLKRLDTTEVNTLMESPVSSKISSDSLIEASKENPNIDVAKIEPVTIKAKPKQQMQSSEITDAYLDSMLNDKRQDILNKKEYGGELEQYQTAGQVTGETEYVEEITFPNGTKGKRVTKGNTISIVDASGTVLKSQTIKPNYRTINPSRLSELEKAGIKLTVPKRYEGKEWSMTPGKQGSRDGSGSVGTEDWYAGENKEDFDKRQARFLRFYPGFDVKKKEDKKLFQTWYNSDIYDQSIKAGLSEEEAQKNVTEFGFDPDSLDPNRLDSEFGHYTWSRPTINISKIPPTIPPRDIPPNPIIPPIPRRPIGFYPQDVLNTAAAVGDLASINKYNPRMVQFNAQPMKPTYYDPNRELANNAEMVNIATQNLAQFTGPQAFNSRFSEVQGKGLANAANIESRYNNLNVGVANQFEQANKQMTNEIDFRNQLAANDFYDKTVIANQQFDNSKRLGRRQVVDYTNAGLDNRFITDQMNSLYPNYFVDPAMLKTYYNQTQQLPAKQRGQDMMTYLEATGIPFDFKDPAVQAALLKGIMGDVNLDERGNIGAAQAGMSRRRSKTS